jgi:hypothetical protein
MELQVRLVRERNAIMAQDHRGPERPFKKVFDVFAEAVKQEGAIGVVAVIITPGRDIGDGHLAGIAVEFAGIPEFTQQHVILALANATKIVAKAPDRERTEINSPTTPSETKH